MRADFKRIRRRSSRLACVAALIAGSLAHSLSGSSPFGAADAKLEPSNHEYLVLLERGADPEFRSAAERLASVHQAKVELFDAEDLDSLQSRLRMLAPIHAAFVVAPEKIDVQFVQDLIERLVSLDDDPFLDVRFAFITGRDGAAAERFVAAGEEARRRQPTGKALMFGSWEGPVLPPKRPLTSLAAMNFDAAAEFVLARDPEELRAARTKAVMLGTRSAGGAGGAGSGSEERVSAVAGDTGPAADADLLLLFSHGFPDRMEACFSGRDLREWGVKLAPGVVINCACWNGCPGRWWMPGSQGFVEQPAPERDVSIALAMLETGTAAYIAGVDPWHGPLANQATMHLIDGGLSLGDTWKALIDRLAIDFAPEPIRFGPVAERRFTGEGRDNRRRNAAGMIVYGDPAWAPFAATAPQRLRGAVEFVRDPTPPKSAPDRALSGVATPAQPSIPSARIVLECDPLVRGEPGEDFMLAHSRLLDYHSVRSADVMHELSLEMMRVVDWPEPLPWPLHLRVTQATAGTNPIRIRAAPQALLEQDGARRRLHLRVPLDIRAYGTAESFGPAINGARIVLEATPPHATAQSPAGGEGVADGARGTGGRGSGVDGDDAPGTGAAGAGGEPPAASR